MKTLLAHREARLTFLVTLLFFIAFYTLIVPLPRYLAGVGLHDWQVGLVLGAFGIASLIGRPMAGLATDWLGRRGVIFVGAALFVIGVLAVQLTNNAWLLLIARVLQALGYVAVTTSATARITDVTPAAQRASTIAAFGIAANIAMTLTPASVDGLIKANLLGLSGAFILAVFLALGCILLAIRFREAKEQPVENSEPKARLNLRATDNSQSAIRNPHSQLWSLPRPLLEPWLAAALMGVGFGAWLQYLPLLTERRGVEPAGLLYAVYGITIIATRVITGPLLDQSYERSLLAVSFVLMTLGLLIFGFTHSFYTYAPATMLIAASGGILHPLLMAMHVRLMPEEMRGRAVATFYLGFDLGNGLGTWLLGFVLDGWGLTALFVGAAISALIGLVLIGFWRIQNHQQLQPAI